MPNFYTINSTTICLSDHIMPIPCWKSALFPHSATNFSSTLNFQIMDVLGWLISGGLFPYNCSNGCQTSKAKMLCLIRGRLGPNHPMPGTRFFGNHFDTFCKHWIQNNKKCHLLQIETHVMWHVSKMSQTRDVKNQMTHAWKTCISSPVQI